MTCLAPIASSSIAATWVRSVSWLHPVTLDDVTFTDAAWLIEVDAYTGSGASTRLRPAGLCAGPVAASPLGSRIDSGLTTLRLSDAGWIGEPNDADRPNAYYPGRVEVPLRVNREVAVMPEDSRRLRITYGTIDIMAGDAALDAAVARWAVSRRAVRVYRGRRRAPYTTPFSTFAAMFSGVGVSWSNDGTRVKLEIRDLSYRLETPFQTLMYGGTGGADGGSDLKGKAMPFTIGRKRNVKPDLVDDAHLVYRFHCRAAHAVLAARDRGGALSVAGNYATHEALIAAPLSSSQYATCLALGLVRTGALSPCLTLDIEGDAVGGYVDTHGDCARRLFEYAGVAAASLVSESFADLPTGTAGWYWGSDKTSTTADALSEVVGSCVGWWGPGRDGRYAVGLLVDPAGLDPTLSIDTMMMREAPTEVSSPGSPRWRQRVEYRVLGTTQASADLLGEGSTAVSAADRSLYGTGYLTATTAAVDIQTRWPDAEDPDPHVSAFDDAADAQTLADRLLARHRRQPRLWNVKVGPYGHRVDVGDAVRLTYPRFGLADGPVGVAVGVDEEGDDVTLTILILGD